MKIVATSLLMFISFISLAFGEPATNDGTQKRITCSDQVFDFGHVGIDFELFHTYYIANNGDTPVTIKSAVTLCDCSSISFIDSLIQPGDTAYFHLVFSTRNFYGSTSKSVVIILDDHKYPEIKFFYLSTIGQWHSNFKPEPFSLFFLPNNDSKQIKLSNRMFKQTSWKLYDQGHNTFKVNIIDPQANRGEQLSLSVTPADDLTAGTYLSSFTVHVTADDEKPQILTIPVKIVKY